MAKCSVLIAIFLGLIFTATANAQLTNPQVNGNVLTADIALAGVSAELRISFEQVVGLSVANLGLTADLVSPTDPDFFHRLPTVGSLSLPAAFPLRITIDPPVGGGLSYSGLPSVEIYTHDLNYVPGTPLRLFAAAPGGTFTDVSSSMSPGSYRVIGRKPDMYGEYTILQDTRFVERTVEDKLYSLEHSYGISSHLIAPNLLDGLTGLIDQIRAAVDNDDGTAAAQATEVFLTTVEANAGPGIPNVWRSSRDLENVDGTLRSLASTLLFSLVLQESN